MATFDGGGNHDANTIEHVVWQLHVCVQREKDIQGCQRSFLKENRLCPQSRRLV
jgi:hypothetical protein